MATYGTGAEYSWSQTVSDPGIVTESEMLPGAGNFQSITTYRDINNEVRPIPADARVRDGMYAYPNGGSPMILREIFPAEVVTRNTVTGRRHTISLIAWVKMFKTGAIILVRE